MRTANFVYKLLTASGLFFFFGIWVNAQPKLSKLDIDALKEKVGLVTDRDIYCVDEDILFSAFNLSNKQIRDARWSDILYVELIDSKGTPIIQQKFAFANSGTDGKLKIPDWILSGNYYLKAYTRWMRNYSTDEYAYKLISVVNPFRADLIENTTSLTDTTGLFTKPQIINSIQLKTDKTVVAPRGLVNFSISKGGVSDLAGKVVVSVVKKGTEVKRLMSKSGESSSFVSKFIPETRGVSISGIVINSADSAALASKLVGLTLYEKSPENLNISTTPGGNFFFDLGNQEGKREMFISSKQDDGNVSQSILIDNDFSSQKVDLPFVPMSFTPQMRQLYNSLSINTQVKQRYRELADSVVVQSSPEVKSFYGKPESVVRFDNYIKMPTVGDYFFELIHKVRIKKDGGKTFLKMYNVMDEMEPYDPLVLIDMVSVFDIDKVLQLDPEKLDRVEIISTPYIRGNITYGGIVSFFSKKHDMAGIDLPSSGRFISYQLLSKANSETEQLPTSVRIPDLRNCLYWNPGFEIASGEQKQFSFNVGDDTGAYVIILQGFDNLGKLKTYSFEITVE